MIQRWSISKAVRIDRLLVLAQAVQMLHRAFLLDDGLPDFRRVHALGCQQFLQIGIAHREGARQGLVGVDIGRDRLDAGDGAAADDADRGGRRDRDLVAETGLHALLRRVRAGAALFRQDIRRRISFAAYLLEDAQIPGLGHGAFQRDDLGLQEGVEAHHAQADRALAQGANIWRAPCRRARSR